MPLRVMLVLSAADKETLMQAEKKNPDWRVRERARSVLLLAQGKTCAQVAALQELSMRTVSSTRKSWIAAGLNGLADLPRSGAPAKVSKQEAERLLQWARDEPLTLTALKARHEEAGGTPVHPNTLTALLKANGFVVYLNAPPQVLWERTRHDKNRPLLKVEDPLRKLQELFVIRDPLYREVADFVVDDGKGNAQMVVQMLAREVGERWNA